MGMQKAIAAVVGGLISVGAVYGMDVGPIVTDIIISGLTVAAVYFWPNK